MNNLRFINRIKEQTLFQQILTRDQAIRILLISGDAGMGKTSLLMMFRMICENSNIPNVYIHLYDVRFSDFSATLAQIADIFGLENFPEYTKHIQTLPTYNFHSDVGIIKSTDFERNVEVPGTLGGLDIESRKLYRSLITDAFFRDLINLSEKKPVVIFFDDFDAIGPEMQDWFKFFLNRIIEIGNLIVVIAGRQVPELPSGWNDIVLNYSLSGLTLNEWIEYAKRLNLALPEGSINAMLEVSKGNPMIMTMYLSTLGNQGG